MSTISASTTSTTAYKVTADTTGVLTLQTGATPTTAVTIDGSQNVGIGTSSPTGKLQVKAANPQIWMEDSAAGTNGKFTALGTSNGAMTFNRYLDNGTLAGEWMRIDSSGNLIMAGGEVRFTDSTRSIRGGSTGQVIVTASSGGFYQLAGGSYYLVTTAGGATSDETLKKNMQPVENALSKVCAISGITYEFIDEPMCDADKGTQIGVGAQTVEAQFPEIVLTQEDGKKTVRYDRLVAPLIEAIKELKAELDAAKADIATLKGAA